jgi:hypothetical protein
MKTNNLILLLFGVLFAFFGFIVWWFRNRSTKFVSDATSEVIKEQSERFTPAEIIKSGGSVLFDYAKRKASWFIDNKTNTLKK